jgi:hypothetical protein
VRLGEYTLDLEEVFALSGKYLPRGSVWWMWNEETSETTSFSYFV